MVVGLLIGLLAGALCVWLAVRSRLGRLLDVEKELASAVAAREVEQKTYEEKLALLEDAKRELTNVFKAQSADALKSNNKSFVEAAEQLVKPLKESLEKVDGQFRVLDQARGALVQQLRSVVDGQETLRRETGALVTALRKPHVRGKWGEMQLRNVLDRTGMLEHCDFDVQSSTRDAEGGLLRPDLIVHMPGGKQVVVDAKVPLTAYLDAAEAVEDTVRDQKLAEHARQVRDHIAKLAAKSYWKQFSPSPDFVVMFLPDEGFLRAALEVDATINEDAWRQNVVLASPSLLFAMLRTVAATWQQETVAQSAREVHALGQELYERVGNLGGYLHQLGRSLTSAVGNYNKTIGTIETRVLVTGRKLQEHGIVGGELPSLEPIAEQARPLTAEELVAAVEDGPRALDAA